MQPRRFGNHRVVFAPRVVAGVGGVEVGLAGAVGALGDLAQGNSKRSALTPRCCSWATPPARVWGLSSWRWILEEDGLAVGGEGLTGARGADDGAGEEQGRSVGHGGAFWLWA